MNQPFLVLPILLLFICTSCDDNRHIRHYRIEKQSVPKISIQPTTSPASNKWTVPSNWIPTKGSSMRIGSFDLPFSNGTGDLSVIKLGGTAGGLAPNINRWRGQLNLGPHTEEDIHKYIQNEKSPLGQFQWFTIINPENNETAFLASIFQTETHTIFVKLSASTEGITQLKSQFIEFCKSFTVDTVR
ncbi:MAG: hypothetical protein H8E72_07160 [Candidatus Marinimicrobia bacterium]|nr:hypothetical protein [Candidatus Neomarinimicrobiota bacterium]